MNFIHNIILLDFNTDFSELDILNFSESEIISFDYETHQQLDIRNLKHIISDNFLSENDLLEIQKNSYFLSNWYKNDSIKNYLDYESVNLGSLFQSEVINVLVNFSKRFLECMNIIKKFGENATYVCGGLNYEIMQKLCSKTIKIKIKNNLDLFFPLDSLNIKMKIGIKNFSKEFNIPQNIFTQLKKITEESTKYLSKSQININEKTILLSEFSTTSYESLFSEFSKSSLNVVVFNRRQPAVWSKKTLSIIKNSGVIVENESTLRSSQIKSKIKNDELTIIQKITNMFEKSDFFNSFFSIMNKSFWDYFSPYFIKYFKHRAKKFIYEIQISKQVLEKHNPSFILILSEVGPHEKILLQLGKLRKIPIFLLQHGLINDSIEGYDHNVANGVIPIESDLGLVWGKINENYLKKIGIPEKKIYSLGTPLFDNFKKLESSYDETDYILLATSGPTKEDSFDLTIKTIEKNIETIKKIADVVVRKYNMKLIVKLHPSPDEFDPTEILKKIDPKIQIIKTGNISHLLKNCKLFVVVDESTAILDSHLLGKPVISVSVKTEEFGMPTILRNDSCALTDISSFEKIFNQMINNNEFRNKIIKNAGKSIQEYISFPYEGSSKLITFFEKYKN